MFRIALGMVLGAAGAASAWQLNQVVQLAPGQAVRLVCSAPNNAPTSMTPNNVTPPGHPTTFNVFCQLRN